MNKSHQALVEQKNQWLHSIVDVEFPTPQSIEGRKLYLDRITSSTFQTSLSSELLSQTPEQDLEIYLVDFHRLTVMFSLLQSKQWSETKDQELIVEFLSQIILTPEHELYVAFSAGEPVAACIVSSDSENELTLVSDVALAGGLELNNLVSVLTKKLNEDQKLYSTTLIEEVTAVS